MTIFLTFQLHHPQNEQKIYFLKTIESAITWQSSSPTNPPPPWPLFFRVDIINVWPIVSVVSANDVSVTLICLLHFYFETMLQLHEENILSD